MTTKTKTVPVKSLRKAIQDGMSFDEAAEHALKALKPELNMFLEEDVDECLDMESLIETMVGTNDHSIKFEVEHDVGDEEQSWTVSLFRGGKRDDLEGTTYWPFQMELAELKAEEDAKTLNRFILDFYGIDKHEVTKKMARERIKRIRSEIARKQKEIKSLEAEMKSLSKLL